MTGQNATTAFLLQNGASVVLAYFRNAKGAAESNPRRSMKITDKQNQFRAADYRNTREKMRLSQKRLAYLLGVSIRTVQRREKAEMLVTSESLLALQGLIHEFEQKI
jgi:DNA-binding transcriptional regulator YiaG